MNTANPLVMLIILQIIFFILLNFIKSIYTFSSMQEEAFYRKYLGGSAMGMHYILRDMPKGADPLGPENVLTLMAGVTTGAAIRRSSKAAAIMADLPAREAPVRMSLVGSMARSVTR